MSKLPLITGALAIFIVIVFLLGFGVIPLSINTNNAEGACWKSDGSCWFEYNLGLPRSIPIAKGYGTGGIATNPYAGMDINFAQSTCTATVGCLCTNPECGGPGVTGSSTESSCTIYDAGNGWVGVSVGDEAVLGAINGVPIYYPCHRIWSSAGSVVSVSLNIIGGIVQKVGFIVEVLEDVSPWEPVQGATVTVDGETKTTGTNGKTSTFMVTRDAQLSFTVSKSGYTTFTGAYTPRSDFNEYSIKLTEAGQIPSGTLDLIFIGGVITVFSVLGGIGAALKFGWI